LLCASKDKTKIDANILCTSYIPIEILLFEKDDKNQNIILSAKKIEWR